MIFICSRLIYDSQNQSSRIERIDFLQEALAPGGNQLDVLMAVASNDRNSSGGSDEDLGERKMEFDYKIQIKERHLIFNFQVLSLLNNE